MDPMVAAIAAVALVALAFCGGLYLGWQLGDGARQVLEVELVAVRLEARTRREVAGDQARAGEVLTGVARAVADAGAAPGGPAGQLDGLLSAGGDRGAAGAAPGGAARPDGGASPAPGAVGARGRA